MKASKADNGAPSAPFAEVVAGLMPVARGSLALVRKAFFRTILSFVRAWMVEERIPRYRAFRNVEAVEELMRALGRNMKEEMALFAFTDAVQFGAEGK